MLRPPPPGGRILFGAALAPMVSEIRFPHVAIML
jgi:hypothetical protein